MFARHVSIWVHGAIGFALSMLFTMSAIAGSIDLVGQLAPQGTDDYYYSDVWAEGDYAYLGSYFGDGVMIIDISDPANPSLVSTYDISQNYLQDVKVYDGIGYFSSDDGDGIHIVDVSTPSTPTLLAKLKAPQSGFNSVHNSSKAGDYLYLADGSTRIIKVFDVSTPASPVFVRDTITPNNGAIHDVTALGTRLYASDIKNGVGLTYIYDVSDVGSSAPTLLGSVPSGNYSHSSWATSDGTILVTAIENNDGEVRIFNIANPASPVLLSTMDRTSLSISAISPHNPVIVNDTLLFISWYEAGVLVIDISDPSNPQKVGHYDTFPGGPFGYSGNWGVCPLNGLDRVVLSDQEAGLLVMDASSLGPVGPAVPSLDTLGMTILCSLLGLAGLGKLRDRSRACA